MARHLVGPSKRFTSFREQDVDAPDKPGMTSFLKEA
jgi:hypothetical protein